MTLPPLPPRKYCIPTHMIFHSQLSPAVFHTWLQLHSLTWHGQQSFTFHLQDWVDLTGTSRITFLRHLDQLQKLHALRWHSLGGRQVHVSFAGVPYPSRAPRRPSARSSPQVASPKMGTPKLASLQPVDPNMGSTKMDISAMRNSLHSLTPQSASIPAFEPGALESSASADPADELVESIPDSRNLESPNPSSSTSSLNSQTSLNSGCKPKKEKIKYLGIELEGGGEREYEGEAGASQSGNLNAQHSSPPFACSIRPSSMLLSCPTASPRLSAIFSYSKSPILPFGSALYSTGAPTIPTSQICSPSCAFTTSAIPLPAPPATLPLSPCSSSPCPLSTGNLSSPIPNH
jgi:hypothetical protein